MAADAAGDGGGVGDEATRGVEGESAEAAQIIGGDGEVGIPLEQVQLATVAYYQVTGAGGGVDNGAKRPTRAGDKRRSRTDLEVAAGDRKSTRLNSSHIQKSRMPSSA